jgi:hypothetical protein
VRYLVAHYILKANIDKSLVLLNKCPYPICIKQFRKSYNSSHHLYILFLYFSGTKWQTDHYNLQETTVRPFWPSISNLIKLSAFITVYIILIQSLGYTMSPCLVSMEI